MVGYAERHVEVADIDPRLRGELTRFGRVPVALSTVRGRTHHELRNFIARGVLPPTPAISTATGTEGISSPAHVTSVTDHPASSPDLHQAYVAHVDRQIEASRANGDIARQVDPMGGGTA